MGVAAAIVDDDPLDEMPSVRSSTPPSILLPGAMSVHPCNRQRAEFHRWPLRPFHGGTSSMARTLSFADGPL